MGETPLLVDPKIDTVAKPPLDRHDWHSTSRKTSIFVAPFFISRTVIYKEILFHVRSPGIGSISTSHQVEHYEMPLGHSFCCSSRYCGQQLCQGTIVQIAGKHCMKKGNIGDGCVKIDPDAITVICPKCGFFSIQCCHCPKVVTPYLKSQVQKIPKALQQGA